MFDIRAGLLGGGYTPSDQWICSWLECVAAYRSCRCGRLSPCGVPGLFQVLILEFQLFIFEMVPLAGDEHFRENNRLAKNGTHHCHIVSHKLFRDGSRPIHYPNCGSLEARRAASFASAALHGWCD